MINGTAQQIKGVIGESSIGVAGGVDAGKAKNMAGRQDGVAEDGKDLRGIIAPGFIVVFTK
jgi:hypothetical protein